MGCIKKTDPPWRWPLLAITPFDTRGGRIPWSLAFQGRRR